MKHIIPILYFFAFGGALITLEEPKAIVSEKDYQPILETLCNTDYLSDERSKKRAEISFWKKKLTQNSGGYLFHEKLGRAYTELFELTGSLDYIDRSIEHYEIVTSQSKGDYKSNIQLALSSNYIKLHEFEKALQWSEAAYFNAKDMSKPALMSFDALMELGDYEKAGNVMSIYKNENSFDYLVRYGKWLDHKGDLDQAVEKTEFALSLLKRSETKKRNWVRTHLADMYGHQGKVEKSYNTYVSVLKEEPYNLHALRGIAWIAFSHDYNTEAALAIMTEISSYTELPDPLLMMSEIGDYQGDEALTKKIDQSFISKIKDHNLEELYNTYLVEQESDAMRALEMAKVECKKRPTPQSYLLVAKSYHNIGDSDMAVSIVKEKVLEKTFEPMALYEAAVILSEGGQQKMGKKLLKEALDAKFELGPNVHDDVLMRLENL